MTVDGKMRVYPCLVTWLHKLRTPAIVFDRHAYRPAQLAHSLAHRCTVEFVEIVHELRNYSCLLLPSLQFKLTYFLTGLQIVGKLLWVLQTA